MQIIHLYTYWTAIIPGFFLYSLKKIKTMFRKNVYVHMQNLQSFLFLWKDKKIINVSYFKKKIKA